MRLLCRLPGGEEGRKGRQTKNLPRDDFATILSITIAIDCYKRGEMYNINEARNIAATFYEATTNHDQRAVM